MSGRGTEAIEIGIVGASRVGLALGRLLREMGEPVVAISSRNPAHAQQGARFIGPEVEVCALEELPQRARCLLIAVRDDAVAEQARRLAQAGARDGLALHTSGTAGLGALEPLAQAGVACGVFHPLQTVPTREAGLTSLRRITFGIGGHPEAQQWARRIAAKLDSKVVQVPDEGWVLYHVGAVIACNYLAALVDAALEVMERAGLPRATALEALGPLVMSTAQNVVSSGPVAALTGPVERADRETVGRHLQELRRLDPALQRLYRVMALQALRTARQKGLGASQIEELEGLLRENE